MAGGQGGLAGGVTVHDGEVYGWEAVSDCISKR